MFAVGVVAGAEKKTKLAAASRLQGSPPTVLSENMQRLSSRLARAQEIDLNSTISGATLELAACNGSATASQWLYPSDAGHDRHEPSLAAGRAVIGH